MTGGAMRTLNETQVRRVLLSGGMLVEAGGQWLVHRSRDARLRAAGAITPLIANRLRSQEMVFPDPDRPGRWIANKAFPTALLPEAVPAPARLARPGRPDRPAPLLVSLVGGPLGDPGETIRLKAAAQRFLADITLAASGARNPSGASRRPASADPQAALRRLAALEADIGLAAFRLLERLIVDRADCASFAREGRYATPELAASAAREALWGLAHAYDLARR